MEAYVLEINKPEHYWSFLNTDAVGVIWVISPISSECLDEYFRNAPIESTECTRFSNVWVPSLG